MAACSAPAVETMIAKIVSLLDYYRKILDSFVIDFFVDDHWDSLPHCWRTAFEGTSLEETCHLLLPVSQVFGQKMISKRVWPLSLLAFVAATRSLSLDRRKRLDYNKVGEERNTKEQDSHSKQSPKEFLVAEHLLLRHVKPKKQHELVNLSQVVSDLAEQTNSHVAVDVGSGQGHLSRYLSYVHGLNVVSIEAEGCHLHRAAEFDSEVENSLGKRKNKLLQDENPFESSTGKCYHIAMKLKPQITSKEFTDLLTGHIPQMLVHDTCREVPGDQDTESELQDVDNSGKGVKNQDSLLGKNTDNFIMIGLHTCGDLGPSIIRIFASSPRALGLVSVGCCYMKTTTTEDQPPHPIPLGHPMDHPPHPIPLGYPMKHPSHPIPLGYPMNHHPHPIPLGYPMSDFVSSLAGHSLSYRAREVACHAIENYTIRTQEDPEHLKVHCYRAIMETVLRKHNLKQAHVKLTRKQSKLPFREYAEAVMKSVGLDTALDIQELEVMAERWWQVAIFFILRVLLAPSVESLVLLDRVKYLKEHGCATQLVPLFNPQLSPRNIVIVARKQCVQPRP